MPKMSFEDQLRDIQSREEATLAVSLRDDGLEPEVEPALLEFRREAHAYRVALRNPRTQSQQQLGEYNALHEDERRQVRQPPTDADWLFFWQTTMQALRTRLYDAATARHVEIKLRAQRAIREWQEGRVTRHRGVIPALMSSSTEKWHDLDIRPGSADAEKLEPRVLLNVTDDMAHRNIRQVPVPHPNDPREPGE